MAIIQITRYVLNCNFNVLKIVIGELLYPIHKTKIKISRDTLKRINQEYTQ